jgi:probable selenium-dependent hydroxylase accessory protein YqeC
MYRLAAAHPGRVGITSTVHMERFDPAAADAIIIDEEEHLGARVLAARTARIVAFARPAAKRGRNAGVAPDHLAAIFAEAGFDACLVKADGARGRLLKAPATHEPVLPPGTATVVAVVSARVIGRPLDGRVVHRPERVSALTGAVPGEPLTPLHVARLLAHPEGALKESGAARVVPLINMVDDARLAQLAAEAGGIALDLSPGFDRVVLAAVRRQGLVDVIER